MAKCADCGLLATRNNETGQWEEVDQNQRDTGMGQTRGKGGFAPIRDVMFAFSWPVCLLRVFDLISEYNQAQKGNESAIPLILKKDRNCRYFREWQLGASPQEHRDMIDRDHERHWHFLELGLILFGNIITGVLVGIAVWLITKH